MVLSLDLHTLVFVIASLGNCSTYLMHKRSDSSTSWSFDVSYVNLAACSVYGYVVIVPLAFYFLLQYLGSNANLVRFLVHVGIFSLHFGSQLLLMPNLPDAVYNVNWTDEYFLLVIPVEFLRWTLVIITGAASASFVALNLRSYAEGNDLKVVLVAAFVLQLSLALFIKMWFFA
ncbi:integral membrane Yip1 family protein [Actinidia rufa]|uniref:Integral membrane Yip1 family protein n=1 Tax=Actinidia rufa TaxID=165716 RepID=A0A7J0EBC0_9ERIC|nr:integral membrane Yip1 family protein [Actinidia rufa]